MRIVPAAGDDGCGGDLHRVVRHRHCADRRDRAVLAGAHPAREDRREAPPSAEARRSRRCACCRCVFGGMLWPIAWLWAYTKPVGYQLAYGTDKHEDYFHEMGEKARAGELLREHELDAPAGRARRDGREGRAARRSCSDAARDELAALPRGDRAAARRTRRRARVMEVLLLGIYCVLRLADLHQAEVAAVEHDDPGHRRHHPDRRA